MNFESIKAWLAQQTRREVRTRWMFIVLGVVLTPLALIVGTFVIFVVALFITKDWKDPNIGIKCLRVAVGSIPVLFLISFLLTRDQTETYYHEESDGTLVGSYMYHRKLQMQLLLWVLFTSPRLVEWVFFSFGRIRQLSRQDTHSCAAVLCVLLAKGKRLPYPDIQKALEWLDLENILPQLAWIPGVLFIKSDPPALTVTDELRDAIREGVAL